jgi:hypothetical protein
MSNIKGVLDAVDFEALRDSKIAEDDNNVLKALSKVTFSTSISGDIFESELKDGTTYKIKRTLEGYLLDISDTLCYLGDNSKSTLISYDRLMYTLGVLASEKALIL